MNSMNPTNPMSPIGPIGPMKKQGAQPPLFQGRGELREQPPTTRTRQCTRTPEPLGAPIPPSGQKLRRDDHFA